MDTGDRGWIVTITAAAGFRGWVSGWGGRRQSINQSTHHVSSLWASSVQGPGMGKRSCAGTPHSPPESSPCVRGWEREGEGVCGNVCVCVFWGGGGGGVCVGFFFFEIGITQLIKTNTTIKRLSPILV